MNATPPVSLSQFGNDASQLNPAAPDSAAPGANSQDFAKALSDAGGKPSRKATVHSAAGRDPNGSRLPAAGNSPPSLPPPSPAAPMPAAPPSAGATPTAALPPFGSPAALTPAVAAPNLGSIAAASPGAAVATGPLAAGPLAAGSPAAASPQSGNLSISTTPPSGWTGAATQPAVAEIPTGGGAEPPQTAATAPSVAGGESTPPAATVEAQAPAAVTDRAPGLNNSLEAALNANQPATSINVAVTAAAGSPKGNDPSGSSSASLPSSTPFMISSAAARAAATPSARAVNGDSASSQAAQAPAPQNRSASQPGTSAANGAPESADTGANAEALGAAMAHIGAAPTSQVPAGDAISPGAHLAMQDTSVNQQDAAMANAAQANAAQASAARVPATALATASAQIAAAAATNAQALLTRASVAADKPAVSSDAMPSLSLDSGAAAGAAQLLANPPVSTQAPSPVLNVAARVDSTEFGQGVASQVSFMVDRNLNSASLQVNPPSLGPIEVRIALQGGHAQVWMTSHSAVTRDALESSSSKLREMLGTQGFGQVSVDISQRSFQERSSQSQSYSALPPMERSAALGAAGQSRSAGTIPRAASGLVDAYA
jgi:flagellar hook-length control protein FliK